MRITAFLLWLAVTAVLFATPARAQEAATVAHVVQPGDTWLALAQRYGLDAAALQAAAGHPNRQRQPVIGDTLTLHDVRVNRSGAIVRVGGGGLLQTAVRTSQSPWTLALTNGARHPYAPPLLRPLTVPGDAPLRELPAGFTTLELSRIPAQPGQAIGFRGVVTGDGVVNGRLAAAPIDVFREGNRVVGLTGTGAFYGAGAPELAIQAGDGPLWAQPWRFVEGDWIFQQLTLTGEAAAIDQEAIQQERERLFAIWEQAGGAPAWDAPFRLPIDSFLEISSPFGARRSYNGGPYRTYHEGVDFAAYGGTPVYAPAAGTAVVAEFLTVRGGAVILDHGLGLYSGYYHMSSVAVAPGAAVLPGQLLGEVGTTGFSTGNHLHWDLLVNATWIDAAAFLEQDMACWILTGLERPCNEQ